MDKKSQDDMREWIARFRDDALTAEETAALNDRLAADPQARELWASHLLLQVLLEKEFGRVQDPEAPPTVGTEPPSPTDCGIDGGLASAVDSAPVPQFDGIAMALRDAPAQSEPGAPRSPVLGSLGNVGRQGWGYVSDHVALFSALAVLLAVTLLALAASRFHRAPTQVASAPAESSHPTPPADGSGTQSSNRPVRAAQLSRALNCHWLDASEPPEPGTTLNIGKSLRFGAGVAEIHFDVGARVVLQSPAILSIESANSARLELGKATVEILSERAHGFKIITPEMTFVDQGTEFGVEVVPGGGTRVHVFKGIVDAEHGAPDRQGPSSTQRLRENVGARMEAGEKGLTLVEDTGECFIRSVDQARRDLHTVAYWRFEDCPIGAAVPNAGNNRKPIVATADSSYNGNDLYTFSPAKGPRFSGDVPAACVPATGVRNRSCLSTSGAQEVTHGVYTCSEFSHASPLDIQQITPTQWTIEASVKLARFNAGAQTFIVRDGSLQVDRTTEQFPPRLAFLVNAAKHFAVSFYDVENRFHEAVVSDSPVVAGRWYHVAAASDSRQLRLYVDAIDGGGYKLRASVALPTSGSTALGKGGDTQSQWCIGRGSSATQLTDFFTGLIDEVRVSDVALAPSEFLFAHGPTKTPVVASPTAASPPADASAGWIKYGGNPVLDGKYGACYDVSLLREDGIYRMWFSWRPKRSIALLESADGLHWTELPRGVLEPNLETGWEDDINRPVVVRCGNVYHMWYTGQANAHSWIGYATSTDGISWKRMSARPVLSPEKSWEQVAVMCPNVLWDEQAKRFRMWYSGGENEPNAIGFATSPDGVAWTKHPANPIFVPDPRNNWEPDRVTGCQVVRQGDWYVMFYIGFRGIGSAQIGLARSKDGIAAWQRHPANPIVRLSKDAWDAEACYKPYALYDGRKWLLWYNGRRGQLQQIGVAVHEGEDLGFDGPAAPAGAGFSPRTNSANTSRSSTGRNKREH